MTIKSNSVIRYRKGATALMKLKKIDERCGYKEYIGMHITGEYITVPADKCTEASEEDIRLWGSYRGARASIRL